MGEHKEEIRRSEIRNWMREVKGRDFPKWYNGLTDFEKEIYKEEFEKLQKQPHKGLDT
jgi:hypothetical protein